MVRLLAWPRTTVLGLLSSVLLAVVESSPSPGGVDDLSQFRSARVVHSFDASKVAGRWYEVAWYDVGQRGASCQKVENAVNASGALKQRFDVYYGPLPFSLSFTYKPVPGTRGLFTKHKDGAGSTLLELPTVIVDVVDRADDEYELMTEFTQKTVLGLAVQELRFLSRSPSVSPAELEQMSRAAREQGIEEKAVSGMKVVDRSGCADSEDEAANSKAEGLAPPAESPTAASRGKADTAEDGIALVLRPSFTNGTPASLVMISGAAIANSAYLPMLQRLQETAAEQGISLWAGSPWYLGGIPNPVDLKQRVADVQRRLERAGLPEKAKVFLAAHSLGTVFLQDFVQQLGVARVAGQILMGGFLARKHLVPELRYPVPTLTLAAELDGLARITRVAESFFHQQQQADRLPVVVLPGQNHMQFASGSPPLNVRRNDLQAEVEEAVAHRAIAAACADFLALQLAAGSPEPVLQQRLAQRAAATEQLLMPILEAYALEGSRRFGTPEQLGGRLEKACVRGLCPSHSPWAPEAQRLISAPALERAAPDTELELTNVFVKLGGSPVTGQDFHLPNLTKQATKTSSKISISTYSQCYWNDPIDEVLETFDTGFTFTSAQEIGTKLFSRQCTLNVGLGLQANFSEDDPDFCAATNQKALDWALAHAPAKSVQRFRAEGVQLVMGKDLQKKGGPLWLYARLQFNAKEQDGRRVVEVSSPAQKTEQDYWKNHFPFARPSFLPDPGCYHYCKLLSPARAMEWIMVDGLRNSKAEVAESSKPEQEGLVDNAVILV